MSFEWPEDRNVSRRDWEALYDVFPETRFDFNEFRTGAYRSDAFLSLEIPNGTTLDEAEELGEEVVERLENEGIETGELKLASEYIGAMNPGTVLRIYVKTDQ